MHSTSDLHTHPRLLVSVFRSIQERARAWRKFLFTTDHLRAFFALNVLCTCVMIYRNFANQQVSLSYYPIFLVIALPFIYGSAFLMMHFTAIAATDDGRVPPPSKRPAVELALLLAYLFVFLFVGTWAMHHGHGNIPMAQGLDRIGEVVQFIHVRFFSWTGIAWRPGLIHPYVNLLFPLVLLVLIGNRPSSLGFRLPFARPPAMLVWGGFFAIACLQAFLYRGSHTFIIAIAALFAVGLPEEFLYRAALQTRIEILAQSPTKAIILSSFIFAAMHLSRSEGDLIWLVTNAFGPKALLGFVFGHLYYRTRSLLPGSLLHAAFDVALLSEMI